MKVQCLYSAKISSKTSVPHHIQFKSWGPLIVHGIFYSQVIKAFFFFFFFPLKIVDSNPVLILDFLVTFKYLIPWIWKVILYFMKLCGCLKEGRICKNLGSNFVILLMVIESFQNSWISYGSSENLKAYFINRVYSAYFIIFLAFLYLLGILFFTSPIPI